MRSTRVCIVACLLLASLVLTGQASCSESEQGALALPVPPAAPASAFGEGADGSAADRGQVAMTPDLAAAGITELELNGPYEPVADEHHPDGAVQPVLGGRAIMHLASEPPNLNFFIENSSVIRWIYFEVHAALLQFEPSTWQYELDTAEAYDVEDTLVLKGGAGEDHQNVIFGKIVGETDSAWVIESGSAHNPQKRTEVPKADVERVLRETVYTFDLRDDALWHDGHKLDIDDVLFSLSLFDNEHVDCDEKRFKYVKIKRADRLADDVARFFWNEQYFGTLGSFGLDLTILPSHLYNLADKDNKDYEPGATLVRQGEYVNNNPHNIDWVGLGPYKVTAVNRGQFVEATKFKDYWKKDPAESGYLDTIRWQVISNDDLAWQALLNDEVDIFYRVKSEDFFGEQTRTDLFLGKCYKVLNYVGNLGYTVWNTRRPKLADPRVRTALARAFDVQEWIATNYRGYSLWATGSQFWFGPAYNHEVLGLPFDPDEAEDLLADAGWYDRDGDGVVDKDGENLVITALMPSGNKASEVFLQKMQESYRRIGVKVDIQPYEWATFLEHLLDRDFDAANLAWTLTDVESDPEQLWHGKWADGRSSNHSGVNDEEVNALIEAGQVELDPDKRQQIWYDLHARLYELQPYLFGWNVPRKLAVNKRIHGLKLYKFEPGFRMRDIHLAPGAPGTRPIPAGLR